MEPSVRGELEGEKRTPAPDWRQSWIVQLMGYVVAIGTAAAIRVGVCVATGEREAWDSPIYMSFGVPALTIVSAALGFVIVHHAWRWAPIMAATQFMVMVISEQLGPLSPLGLAFLFVLALPGIIAAYLGSFIARFLGRTR